MSNTCSKSIIRAEPSRISLKQWRGSRPLPDCASIFSLFQPLAQQLSEAFCWGPFQFVDRKAGGRRMPATTEVLRQDRKIDCTVGAASEANPETAQIEQGDDGLNLPLVQPRCHFAAI